MSDYLPTSVQRLIAVALGLVALAGVVAIILLPALMASNLSAKTERVIRDIEELQTALIQRENMLAEQRLLERTAVESGLAIEAESTGLAGPMLQSWLRGMVESVGTPIQTTQILEPNPLDDFTEIRVRAGFQSTIGDLREILHNVESHIPVMLVRTMSISREDASADADVNQGLSVDMVIVGYRKIDPANETN